MLEVLEPGLLTTVQDLGRFGWYHIGMPPSGAMDNFSFRVGNLLVGNDENAAGLEMTYTGPTLRVTQTTTVAVTGAELSFRINDHPTTLWQTHRVTAGDILSCGSVVAWGTGVSLCCWRDRGASITWQPFNLHAGTVWWIGRAKTPSRRRAPTWSVYTIA